MKSLITLLFVITVTAQAKPSDIRPREFYVGCRPSAGECVNSCATRKAYWELDATKCDPHDHFNRLACYCLLNVLDQTPKK